VKKTSDQVDQRALRRRVGCHGEEHQTEDDVAEVDGVEPADQEVRERRDRQGQHLVERAVGDQRRDPAAVRQQAEDEPRGRAEHGEQQQHPVDVPAADRCDLLEEDHPEGDPGQVVGDHRADLRPERRAPSGRVG
jgi:hypothetical protein